jgi:mono/diheme cytochrome c family protein
MSPRTLRPVIASGAAILLLASAAAAFAQGNARSQPPTGAAMYQAYCAPCHGRKGVGDGPVASSLKSKPTDLTRLAKGSGGRFPAERLGMVLLYGVDVPAHGSTDMPLWGSMFRELGDEKSAQQRVTALSRYVETLQVK